MIEDHWQPLLDGDPAVHARMVALEIALTLERESQSPQRGLRGDASVALLLAYIDCPSASKWLERALVVTMSAPVTMSLFDGISGTAWVLQHLTPGHEIEALVAHVDTALLRSLDVPRWTGRYDLISGLAGVGVYVSSRSDDRALQIADYVLSHLEATATMSNAGATWSTPPQFLLEPRRSRYPGGVIDLGVAHGVPGVIGMLARFVEVDMHGERSRRLLEAAIAWLLYSVPHDVPRFGASWPASDGGFKRIGWCYGDAGVAGALLHASHALKSSTLEELALELLLQMTIPLQSQGVADASFCHGASGLAHIYNVAFQRTKNLQMRTQAELWLAEVLRLRSPGTGIAGYASLKIDGHAPRWEPDATLLSGAVGIALVLLAAVENRKPTWGQLFLL